MTTLKKTKIAICLFLYIHLYNPSWGLKILDPQNFNSFFNFIHEELDIEGIDIVQDWQSNVLLEGRPTLAPIANYKLSFEVKENEWTKAFSSFYANALAAIPSNESIIASDFLKYWDLTPIEKRVFISFTREDLFHVEKVKKVLESKGYKVFLYTESNREVFNSAEMIVHCMKTSGEVLILDTEFSRQKSGVLTEALSFAKYSYKPEKKIIEENENLKKKAKNLIDNIKIEKSYKAKIIDNVKSFFEEKDKKKYSTIEILKKVNQKYKTSELNLINNKDIILAKKGYEKYLFNTENLSPYALNKKLTSEIYKLEFNWLDATFEIISMFAICPYYKIPMRICPICSRALK